MVFSSVLSRLVAGSVVAAAASVVLVAPPASAVDVVFTVNTEGDALGTSDAVCDVDPDAPGDQCTFAEALNDAWSVTPATIAFDTADFSTPYRVTLDYHTSYYVPEGTTIDGTTQPGYDPAGGVVVNIDGGGYGGGWLSYGLILGPLTTVRGLALTQLATALTIDAPYGYGVTVAGNWIGTVPGSDRTDTHNETGIAATYASNGGGHTIGGTAPGDRNVIVNSYDAGIEFNQTRNEYMPAKVIGNYIGVLPDGTPASNGVGIHTRGGANLQIGQQGAGNVISGNGTGILNESTNNVEVSHNKIGTDPTGTAAVPNGKGILEYTYYDFTPSMDYQTSFHDNLISGNTGAALRAEQSGSADLSVRDNVIGLDVTGTQALPNGSGVVVYNYYIGGYRPDENTATFTGNVIASNRGPGMDITYTRATIGNNTVRDNEGHGIALTNNRAMVLSLIHISEPTRPY